MKAIGKEMDKTTGGALRILDKSLNHPRILDLCCAPGGFLATTLGINPGAQARGISLPVDKGGHKVRLPEHSNVTIDFLDITMLAADMGATEIPPEHADVANFLPRHFDREQFFDLVVCDGQILRKHNRADYRKRREPRRLTLTQFAIGLEHLRPAGTMVILLHKPESPDTMQWLYVFSKFSSVQLFKPVKHHVKRSSCYMIATNVQTQCPDALEAVETWKNQWQVATFGTDTEYEEDLRAEYLNVEMVLKEFGPELVKLGKEIWAIQARGLSKASFMKNPSKASFVKKQAANDRLAGQWR